MGLWFQPFTMMCLGSAFFTPFFVGFVALLDSVAGDLPTLLENRPLLSLQILFLSPTWGTGPLAASSDGVLLFQAGGCRVVNRLIVEDRVLYGLPGACVREV